MWCPDCGAEYRAGFHTCADCGTALVAELDRQPGAGSPDLEGVGLEPCLESASREEVANLAAALEGSDIPYVLQAGTALALLDGERLFGGKHAGSWEGRLWVHAASSHEAARLLAAVRARLKAAADPADLPEAQEGETAEEFERRHRG